MCAGCARGIGYVGWWTETDAPFSTWQISVKPNVRTHPAPAVPQARGVGDAAPYGWEGNKRNSIQRSAQPGQSDNPSAAEAVSEAGTCTI